MASLSDIASALHARRFGKHWLARCPAHDDAHPSLSLTERNGRVLAHCHAGCSQQEVIAALRDLGLWAQEGKRRSTVQAADPEYAAAYRCAQFWRESFLSLADETLAEMRTTDPERRSVTRRADEVGNASAARLVALFRQYRQDNPEMTAAMIAIAQRNAANEQRRLANWILKECNGQF